MNRVHGSMNRIHVGPVYESMKFNKLEPLAIRSVARI
jgi:hypothetical protein